MSMANLYKLMLRKDLNVVLIIYLSNPFFFKKPNIIIFLIYDIQTFKLLEKIRHILYTILLCLYHNLHILVSK